MQEDNQNPDAEDFLKELPIQTEEIGYRPDEMISCEKCLRTNPPNRLKCMYCGSELELSDEQTAGIAPVLRKLEIWENGFNLIYLPKGENVSAGTTTQVAKLIGLESEVLQKIFEANKNLPIARAESAKEAEILQDRLRDLSLETSVISDELLAAENTPKRLRGLEFHDDKILLILFNNDEVEEIKAEDLILIVSGANRSKPARKAKPKSWMLPKRLRTKL